MAPIEKQFIEPLSDRLGEDYQRVYDGMRALGMSGTNTFVAYTTLVDVGQAYINQLSDYTGLGILSLDHILTKISKLGFVQTIADDHFIYRAVRPFDVLVEKIAFISDFDIPLVKSAVATLDLRYGKTKVDKRTFLKYRGSAPTSPMEFAIRYLKKEGKIKKGMSKDDIKWAFRNLGTVDFRLEHYNNIRGPAINLLKYNMSRKVDDENFILFD